MQRFFFGFHPRKCWQLFESVQGGNPKKNLKWPRVFFGSFPCPSTQPGSRGSPSKRARSLHPGQRLFLRHSLSLMAISGTGKEKGRPPPIISILVLMVKTLPRLHQSVVQSMGRKRAKSNQEQGLFRVRDCASAFFFVVVHEHASTF